jgi:outer membrane protein assembly factor BamB
MDADTGEIIWEIKGSRTWSTPAIAEGKVVIGYGLYSDEGLVSCFDAFTGKWLWSIKPDRGVKSSPVIVDGKVYVGSNVGRIYCIDLDEGFLHWRYLKGGEFESSPAIVDGKLFIGSKDKNVYCLDAETGNEIWIRSVGYEIHLSTPVVFDQRVYIGTYDDVPHRGHVFCLNANNGDIIWDYLTGGWIDSSPAIFEEKLYVGSRDSNLYCFDAIIGDKIWDFYTDGSIRSSPAVADGKVYFGSGKGVFCLDAESGTEIWRYKSVCVDSSPAISGGKLYIGIYKNIFCFYDDEESDLNCKGRLEFFDIKPKSTLRTKFRVYNVGKPGSNLNWEIGSYPDWGEWSSNPSFGVNLKPEDGEFIVELEVIVPEDGHTVFEGKLKIINSDNPDDFDSLFITIATNRVKSSIKAIAYNQLFRFIESKFFMLKNFLNI